MIESVSRDKDTVRITVAGVGTYEVRIGSNLREALRREGVYVDGTCSDNGTCGRCVVRIIHGDAGEPSVQEAGLLGEESTINNRRLACRITVSGNLSVSIDPERILEIDLTGRWKEVWDSPLWRPDLFISDRDGFGVAVDLGTTSIASSLVDLTNSRPLDIRAAANPQIPWGEDIISRLGAAAEDPRVASNLGTLVWNTVRDQLRSLCLRNGVSGGRISRIVVVGNTVMHHLSLGLPVQDMLIPPYSPGEISSVTLTPDKLPVRLDLSRQTEMYFAPLVGGFAGSDALVSLLAAKSSGIEKGALLDVGTNTEIAVWNGDSVLVATAPSGPAFEGGHIRAGIRAEEGAIWKVEINQGSAVCEVIGGVQAKGICGTGMIDMIASMLRNDILDRSGLMKAGSHPMLSGSAFVLDNSGGIALKNEDIATIQKAKSAIASTFQVLLTNAGLTAGELDNIFIAGAFGSRLNVRNAMKTGLLPDLPEQRYVLAGNSALVGGSMILASDEMRQRAESLSQSVIHYDLTSDPDFEEIFIDNLYF